MSIPRLVYAKQLRAQGEALGREGMSLRVIAAVEQFNGSGSYKAAMVLAGRLKAIAQMAGCDDYWSEQVDKGFHLERRGQSLAPRVLSNPVREEA